MDYGKLIIRSFEITWKYRALWIFGILFSLLGGSNLGGTNANYSVGSGDFGGQNGRGVLPDLRFDPGFVLTIILVIGCVLLVWLLLAVILRIISRGALIGLAYELEAKQTEPRFRHGWDLGTERFFPLLGISLLINVPLAIISIFLFVLAALPIFAALFPLINSSGRTAPDQLPGAFFGGIAGSIALICCVALVLFVVNLVIRPIFEFAVRACVISRKGVIDSLGDGYRKARTQLGQTIILYVLVIGIGIGYGILMIPVALILIAVPAVLAISAFFVANSIVPAIIVALVLGIPILILLLIINGFYHAFENNLWTEGYLAMDARTAPPVPVTPTDSAAQVAQG